MSETHLQNLKEHSGWCNQTWICQCTKALKTVEYICALFITPTQEKCKHQSEQDTWFILKWKQYGGITRRERYLSRFVCAVLHCVSGCLLLLLFQSSQQAAEDNYVLITWGWYCCEERTRKESRYRLSCHLDWAWLAHSARFDNIMLSVLMEFFTSSCTLGDFWLWKIWRNVFCLLCQLLYTFQFSVLLHIYTNCGVQRNKRKLETLYNKVLKLLMLISNF